MTKECTMSWPLRNWFERLTRRGGEGRPRDSKRRPARPRLRSTALSLERLEDRTVLSAHLALSGSQALFVNANVRASNNAANGTMESEMSVDVNPANPLQVAGFTHNIFNLNQIQLFFSTNGGATWSRRVLGNTSGGDFVNDGWGNVERFDPGVKFDANGNLFVSYGAGNRIVVAESTNGGSSFSNFFSLINESGIDKPQIATGPSNFGPSVPAVYVSWTRNLADGQHIAISGFRPGIDAGFTAPVNISNPPNSVLFSDPAVGPNGEVYVVWQNYAASDIRFNINLNFWGGAAWAGEVVAQHLSGTMGQMVFYTGGGTASFPQPRRGIWNAPTLDVDRSGGPHNGRVYIAYGTLFSTPPGNDTDVWLNYSDNKGASWTSNTVAFTTATEFLPWLAVDQDTGSVNVAYYTTSGLPGTDCRLALASSIDGGASFTSTFVASQPTRSNVVNYGGDMLEYIGLAARDGTAQAFWADNRGPAPGTFQNTFESETASVSTHNAANQLLVSGDGTLTLRSDPVNGAFADVIHNGVLEWAGLWASLGSVTITTGSGNDTVNIENTVVGVPVTVNLGGGTDTINVSPTAHFLGNLQGNLTLNGGSGVDTLNVFDQGNPFNVTYMLTASSVTRTGSALISYGSLFNFVNINGGGGTDTYNVNGTEQTYATTLDTGSSVATVNVIGSGFGSAFTVTATTGTGGGGADVVNIGNGSLAGISGAGSVTIENEKSVDTVNINDQNDNLFQGTVTLSTVIQKGSIFGRLSGIPLVAPISWDYPDTASVTINTGSGGAKVTVLGTGVPTFLNGNSLGTNTLVGGNLLTAWHVTSANAGNLSNALASATFTVFQNLTSGSGGDGFIFNNTATLSGTLNGGGGSGVSLAAYTTNLTVNVTGGGSGTIPGVVGNFLGVQYMSAGSGSDRFVFSNAGSMTSIDGGPGGNDTLDASAVNNRNLSVLVYGANAGTVPGMVFEFADIENVTAGSRNNTFVLSDGASLAGTANGGVGGSNTLDTSPYSTGLTYSLTASNGGSVAGVLGAFANFRNVLGADAGGNTCAFFAGGSLAGELDGGVGVGNFLDYANYPAAVTVDLSKNLATGLGKVVNIQELRGGAGNDHLTGNGAGGTTFFASPGSDTITGLGSGNTLFGTNADSTWNIASLDAGTLTFGASTTTFSGMQNLVGGTGADAFTFADAATVDGSINGGLGNNTLDTSLYSSNELFSINAANGGAATVVPAFGGIQKLKGGGASNTFRFSDGGSLAGSIIGASAAGTGTLDYSSGWSDTVIVDLQTGQASGVAGHAMGAVTNIINVNGASGGGALGKYNLLIGNGGNGLMGNSLMGGNGRDNLLVAGGSTSGPPGTLVGGDGVDLLIGGTTVYDTLDAWTSWKSIADYWATTAASLTQRSMDLQQGLIVPRLDWTMDVTGNNGGNTMTGNGGSALIYTDGNDNPTGYASILTVPISP
jgi:hypothetical protein